MVEYIHRNITTYLDNVFFSLPNNDSETESSFIELLNNTNISTQAKFNIINKQQTKITDIKKILNLELWELLFKVDKIKPTWRNILVYYQETSSIDKILAYYINNHHRELASIKFNQDNDFQEEVYNNFAKSIIRSDDIQDSYFNLLIGSVPYSFESMEMDLLSEKRIDALINSSVLALSQNSFNWLHENYPEKIIPFIERQIENYIKDMSNYDLDATEISMLLSSSKLTPDHKKTIVNQLDMRIIPGSNSELIRTLLSIVLATDYEGVREEILNIVIENNDILLSDKLELIIKGIDHLPKQAIMNSFAQLKTPYSEIAISGRRPTIKDSNINRKLVDVLLEKEYISSWTVEGDKLKVNTKRS